MEMIVALVISFLSGGGIAAFISARSKSKVDVVTSALALVAQYERRITDLEAEIAELRTEIAELRAGK